MSDCFIIAELGVNFRDLNEADIMIREAAAAGVDACKFQAFRYGTETFDERLKHIALDETAVRYLYWRCQAAGVEFMCTPMYPEAVAMLDPYVNRWKIRFKDRENEKILEPCQATGKPILVSGKNIFCIPEYPPKGPLGPTIPELRGFDGYSCHFPDIGEMAAAVSIMKLKYLEAHVKRDEYNPPWCPVDNAVSITMTELRELCRGLK